MHVDIFVSFNSISIFITYIYYFLLPFLNSSGRSHLITRGSKRFCNSETYTGKKNVESPRLYWIFTLKCKKNKYQNTENISLLSLSLAQPL